MRAEMPSGAFTSPVGFSITRVDPATLPPDGDVDPVVAHQFDFAVPTLNSAAEPDLRGSARRPRRGDARGPPDRARLGHGDPGDEGRRARRHLPRLPALRRRRGAERRRLRHRDQARPKDDGPSGVRFSGVVGHFSTWAVAIAAPPRSNPPPPLSPSPPDLERSVPLDRLERLQVRQGEAEPAQANRVAGRQGPRAGIALAPGQGNQAAAQGRASRRHGEADGQTDGQGEAKARADRQADRQGSRDLPAQRRQPRDEDEEDPPEASSAPLRSMHGEA